MPEFRTNQALVLSARPLGERSYIVSLLTPDHGRHIGVFQKRHPPETGAWVSVRWRARLAEQMGQFYLEEVRPFSVAYLDDKKRLACITCLCRLLDDLLNRIRQNSCPCPAFYGNPFRQQRRTFVQG